VIGRTGKQSGAPGEAAPTENEQRSDRAGPGAVPRDAPGAASRLSLGDLTCAEVDRRKFLELSGYLAAALALPGCSAATVARPTPAGGEIRFAVADFPQLEGAGGFLRVLPQGNPGSGIFVLTRPEGGYVALSPICTHLGCTVNVEGSYLVCPCHGSTYDRNGTVVRGPAERPLAQYRTELTAGGELIIRTESTP
jgi:nitrite reductase/ring-hydroxylating ferredoxin subunit